MDRAEFGVPCRVGLEKAHRLDNLCSGEFYTSVLDGSCKSFRSVVPSEWELDSVGLVGAGRGQLVEGQVKSASQVVDRIADEQRKMRWDGLLCFGAKGGLTGLA